MAPRSAIGRIVRAASGAVQQRAPALLDTTVIFLLRAGAPVPNAVFRCRGCLRIALAPLLHLPKVDDLAHPAILPPGYRIRNPGGF